MLNYLNNRTTFFTLLVITGIVLWNIPPHTITYPYTKPPLSFFEIGTNAGTDKVTSHRYECLYEETLAPYRHAPGIKLLEIGLGCNMPYGPGASYNLWTQYFDDVQVYFLEYNQTCGERWVKSVESLNSAKPGNVHRPKIPIMSYGDQGNEELLQKMKAEHGPWDLIVDDGGHMMYQQIGSFNQLFAAVKPGGIYFLEDLATSLWLPYGGTATGVNTPERNTSISLVAKVLADSISVDDQWTKHVGLGSSMERLLCCDQICAFRVRKNKPV